MRALELTTGDDSGSSDEYLSNDDRSTSTPKGHATNLMNLLKKSSSQSSGINLIEEEEPEIFKENILEHIEKHAGSALD